MKKTYLIKTPTLREVLAKHSATAQQASTMRSTSFADKSKYNRKVKHPHRNSEG